MPLSSITNLTSIKGELNVQQAYNVCIYITKQITATHTQSQS